MANKKDLKKSINFICEEIIAECIARPLYDKNTSSEHFDAIISSVLITRDDFISRISNPEPGYPKKKYFDKLINDFTQRIEEIIDNISNMN